MTALIEDKNMLYTPLKIKDAYLVEIEKICDHRGFFARGFCKKEMLDKTGIDFQVCQVNISSNLKRGTIRGMHYQKAPYEGMKIVSCVKGAIFDVILDLRKQSPTYLQWLGFELSEHNHSMLIIPTGCAHGFQVLQDDTVLHYKENQYFTSQAEIVINYQDAAFGIEFPIKDNVILSEKDLCASVWEL